MKGRLSFTSAQSALTSGLSTHKLHRYSGKQWAMLYISLGRGRTLPVDTDSGPGGMLIVLGTGRFVCIWYIFGDM